MVVAPVVLLGGEEDGGGGGGGRVGRAAVGGGGAEVGEAVCEDEEDGLGDGDEGEENRAQALPQRQRARPHVAGGETEAEARVHGEFTDPDLCAAVPPRSVVAGKGDGRAPL
uniref:CBL06 n=1 Tax=Arundo donax TaxID=35708 RepID=A0A0A9DKL3_ARUDO